MNRSLSFMVMGTDTGVGKTVVTALLAREYRRAGIRSIPFKPIASGGRSSAQGSPINEDLAFLAGAIDEEPGSVGLYRLSKPLSPHLAAEADKVDIKLSEIRSEYERLSSRFDAVLVEGAGGIMVPINDKDFVVDIAVELGLAVVLVARAGLGTINHTLLSIEACRARGVEVAGLIFNRYPNAPDDAEASNPEQLQRLSGVPVIGLLPELDVDVAAGRWDGLDRGKDILDLGALETGPLDFSAAIEADRDCVWHPFSQMREYLGERPNPLMIVGGRGSRLRDSEGRQYIDGVSSLWVNIHGHRNRRLDGAITKQLGKVAHTTLLGLANEPSALLARRLVEITPPGLSRVFYSDSGSTAVEIALKVAFQFHKQTGRSLKKEFVSFANAYHGDTIGAVSVGGQDLFHSIFKPLLFETHSMPAAYCFRCPIESDYPGCELACLDELETFVGANHERLAGLIFEPKVQGAAGIIVQPPGYMTRVGEICRRHDLLLIADEVATGFGRTGELFACGLEGLNPDIMTLAKGITGGYMPLAATLFREEIYEAFLGAYEEYKTFFHGHTYTGNPLSCAVALENIDLIAEDLFLDGVRDNARTLTAMLGPLAKLSGVGDVRQCGLMAGIELVADTATARPFPPGRRVGRAVTLKAREKGVIIRPLGDTVVLMPPLNISGNDLDELVGATAEAISETLE